MPLYDFRCRQCGEQFEELVPAGSSAPCPACGSTDVERMLGRFAGPFTVGLRGRAAKRSNEVRRSREERRQEGFARQRAQRREQGQ